MSQPVLADFACKICGGPILTDDVMGAYRQHLADLDTDDPPEIARLNDPAKQMVARQRAACAAGRLRAVQAREVTPGIWIAAGTGEDEPYPCRCAEFDQWQHDHGRCACQGRTDTEHLPSDCCAYVRDVPQQPPEMSPETPLYQAPDEAGNVNADEPPRSTLDELRDVLIDYDLSRPRSMQTTLGPSELGTPCLAQIIRKLGGYPPRPVTDPAWAPFQGTAVHVEMQKVVEHWNARIGRQRWIAEDELACGDDIIGHGDAFDVDQQMVIDWKHCGTTALDKLRRAQRAGKPPAEQVDVTYRVQAHLYGAGHAAKGRDVRWVRLVLLARSWKFDDSLEWTERYDPAIAQAAIERYQRAKSLVTALDLEHHWELIASIPRTPHACAWCPFFRPGEPNGPRSCPGDEVRAAASAERFTEGLITVTPSDVL